ncbi:MAG: endo-1,4-beta-xylanase [Dysgonamonadaceae bacterium]|nr:endo-1,4-beta-xylanase [Dysgonamonadaceae bacterium]
MKKIIYLVLAVLTFGLNACYDEKMEWGDPYTHPGAAELPLQLQEKIARYEALTAYTNFKLGVGIDFNLYMSDENYQTIINENFREITPGNELKQSSLMKTDGTLDFSKADPVIDALKARGLTIYGHTLVWHSQQKASYLNSLIAPTIIPGPAGESLLDVTALLDGSFTGWSRNNAAGITVVAGAGLSSSDPAVRMQTTTAGNEWDTQLTSPEFPVFVGHHYEVSFYVKSEDAGQARVSFAGMSNNYPWIDGGALFTTSASWTQIIYTDLEATASAMKVAFDFGKVPGIYYVDINTIRVIDLDAAPVEVNFVENGGFETGDLTNWTAANPGGGITVTAAAKFEGNYGLQGIASASSANEWDLQFQTPEIMLDPAKTYTMSFYIKSDVEGKGRISFPGFDNEWPWINWDGSGAGALFTTNATWQQISFDITPAYKAGANTVKISFDLGKVAGATYFVDNVKVIEKPAAAASSRQKIQRAPIIIEMPWDEKVSIIESVLTKYVTDVASHFAGKVAAWDVVNEPLNDNGTVRTGEEDLKATDVFYWQYYLGQEYAVKAFKWAREADPNAKLFINDYGLESPSGAKVEGLIKYVQYIESQGATVHGIGTQLHLNINWTDTLGIQSMFEKLAATGKLIKVSELDIAIANSSDPESPVSPTAEQYEQQANLYRFVAEMYSKCIPEAQRYGITVWGISDSENEHEYWLKNDAPCLWDAEYARKHAYKGFADGLAGKDVSADFSGELKY